MNELNASQIGHGGSRATGGSVGSVGGRETGGGRGGSGVQMVGQRWLFRKLVAVGVGSIGRSGVGTSSSSVGRGESVAQVIGSRVV